MILKSEEGLNGVVEGNGDGVGKSFKGCGRREWGEFEWRGGKEWWCWKSFKDVVVKGGEGLPRNVDVGTEGGFVEEEVRGFGFGDEGE